MKLEFTTTTYEGMTKRVEEKSVDFVEDLDTENEIINIYPQMKYQVIDGFGGALTESAGYVYAKMSEEQKKNLMEMYFGKDDFRYSMVRIPIDSCDFSLENYEADADETDENFEKFSFERVDKYIIPLLDDAESAYGGRLPITLSPWSPPAYMKTNGDRNHGGSLKPECRERWAKYICRYISEYRNRGYLVDRLTVQNESKAEQDWDSCIFTAEEQLEFIRDFLHPAMVEAGLDDIGIYIWDHNKERIYDWAETIFDSDIADLVEGVAFHWYSGDHFDALKMVREKYPEKKLLMSEMCIEFRKFDADDYLTNAKKYGHEMIGDMNSGMNSLMDWNILLDAEGGPNHAGNLCDSPYRFDEMSGELVEGCIAGYIWHMTHFMKAGAVRLGTSSYTDKLEVTAVQNGDEIVLLVLNRTSESLPAYIRIGDEMAEIEIEPDSISTCVIEGYKG